MVPARYDCLPTESCPAGMSIDVALLMADDHVVVLFLYLFNMQGQTRSRFCLTTDTVSQALSVLRAGTRTLTSYAPP